MSKTDIPYHSALKPAITATPVDRFDWRGNIALTHNLLADPRLPPPFDPCDVLYVEPPWRAGFEKFNRRAGLTTTATYHDLLAAVSKLITEQPRPTVIITGRHARALLPQPDQTIVLKLYGATALALLYRTEVTEAPPHTFALIEALARRYNRVGDPMCGYGVTARAFTAAGKAWTVSDLNATCIGHIAANAHTWPQHPAP